MKNILSLLLVTVLMATASAQETCSNFYPTFSPDGTALYFSSNREGGVYFIYKANPDGSNLQRLTSNTFPEFAPKVSPDGTKVVFSAGNYGTEGEIYIINSDGSGQVQLTNNSLWDGNPSFSPDGQKIVCEGWDGSNYPEIFIMKTDGSDRQQLTNETGAFWQSQPVFHPGGEKIYFLRSFNADNNIMVMNRDGTNWVEITPPNDFGYAESYINFNHDGSRLVFITSEYQGYGGPFDIISTAADGSDWQRLTMSDDGDRNGYTPCYHPLNGLIYYACDRNNDEYVFDIFSMNGDGTNKTVKISCNDLGISVLPTVPRSLSCDPNPFTETATIPLDVKFSSSAHLQVFDNQGKSHRIDYSLSGKGISVKRGNLSSGLYFFRIISGDALVGQGKFVVE